jgi:hypothetical protein
VIALGELALGLAASPELWQPHVRHAGTGPTVTLHVCSPRLRTMDAYEISPDGRLARHRLPEGAALSPLA